MADGCAETVANGVLGFVENKPGLDMKKVRVFGSDSCQTMIGRKGGAIAIMEQKTGLAFHYFVCLLYHISSNTRKKAK